MSDNKKLLEQLEIDKLEFLEQHPKLVQYQAFIDEQLNAAGDDPELRLLVLSKLLMSKIFDELIPELEQLSYLCFSQADVEKKKTTRVVTLKEKILH